MSRSRVIGVVDHVRQNRLDPLGVTYKNEIEKKIDTMVEAVRKKQAYWHNLGWTGDDIEVSMHGDRISVRTVMTRPD